MSDNSDAKWLALAVIFCTPAGWIGLMIVGGSLALIAKFVMGH